MTKKEDHGATSTELTGGAGFTYEDTVVAYYLAALLRQEPAVGSEGTVVSVAVQRDGHGHPMDDVVVEFEDTAGRKNLGLQAKRKASISAAPSNRDFRGIMAAAAATRTHAEFRKNRDAYGFIAEQVADGSLRSLNRLIDWAKASPDGADFGKRFAEGGVAADAERKLRLALKPLTKSASDDEEADFYRHFVAFRLDGLTVGGARRAEIIARLQEIVASNQDGLEALLFDRLCRIARDGAGRGHKWTRDTLLQELQGVTRLKTIPSYTHDIEIISAFSAGCMGELSETIDDFHVVRPALEQQVSEKLANHRLVNISGLPGCGKSAVLRRYAASRATQGPVLFIKSDRLAGKGWLGFAAGLGLEHSAAQLLAEIGATGTAILFIDGIDRISPDQKGIITDLVSTIQSTPALTNWKILASSRDQGLEAYRSWFPATFYKADGIGDVSVTTFTETEAKLLAAAKPHLQPLLFGSATVSEIARRPFFAGILAEGSFNEECAPQTEIDLINAWWARGGYNAPTEKVLRQRALLDLAEAGVDRLGKGIPQRSLKDSTFSQIKALEADRIIREDGLGETFSFTHDIFFEWTFFRLLIDLNADWRDALIKAGEPPLLGRVVGLLAQSSLTVPGRWTAGYHSLDDESLRPQWRREWLTAPPFSPAFVKVGKEFTDLLATDEAVLEKVLVWFQAQHTVPNPLILQNSAIAASADPIRTADLLGWPSDFASWGRLLDWLIPQSALLPVKLIPQTLEVFGVWQNALANLRNPRSEAIIEQCAAWLIDLEASEYGDHTFDADDKWYDLGREARAALASNLRAIIIRAADAYPDPALCLFARARTDRRMRGRAYSDLMAFTPTMAHISPEAVAAVTKAELIEELPQDRVDREKREYRSRLNRLKKLRAKPEAELTELERRSLESAPSVLFHEPSRMDFNDIGIDRHNDYYNPPSALHEPFASLFQQKPQVALQLVHDLANHAVRGWRQVQSLDRRTRGTPIPARVQFPWGQQEFWGDWHVYSWLQGHGVPQPLECALLALSYWAFKEIEKGRSADEVIRAVVEGSECYAMLGLSLTLALETFQVSETTLPIAACQRLWHHDMARLAQEPFKDFDVFGLGFLSQLTGARAEAKEYLNQRKCRTRDIRQLALMFAHNQDKALRDRFKRALHAFPDDLPYELEEQRAIRTITDELHDRARKWAGLGDQKNYRHSQSSDDMIQIEYQSPEPPTAADEEKLISIAAYFTDQRAYAWARQTLSQNKESDGWTLAAAITYARERDTADMFDERHDSTDPWRQSAIAAVATCAIAFSPLASHEQAWGWAIMDRVMTMREPESFSGSKIAWHPALHLVVSLCRDRASGAPRPDSAARLLELTAYPLDDVVHAAFEALFLDKDEHVRWTAAQRALDLAQYRWPSFDENGGRDNSVHKTARRESLKRALENLSATGDAPLSGMPDAWVKASSRPRRSRRPMSVNEEGWGDASPAFDSQRAAKLFPLFPLEAWLQSTTHRDLIIDALQQFVSWTADRLSPPWQESKRRQDRDTNLYEWKSALGDLLARAAVLLDLDWFRHTLLKPFLANDDEALHVLSAFADKLVVRHIMDAQVIPPNALALLDDCVTRVIGDSQFSRDSYRAGEVSGHELPAIIKALLFVPIEENCSGAARFANGDWSEIGTVMPLVTRLVSATGWSFYVMDRFLCLCERAGSAYPLDDFAEQVNSALAGLPGARGSWSGSTLPARIAGIVQRLAYDCFPMRSDQARSLLRILDALIDLGDRRSAALEQAEAFKAVQRNDHGRPVQKRA